MNKKIMMIAGEASGDIHGAALINEIKKLNRSVEFSGIGGSQMISAGMNSLYDMNDLAFLGIVEVIKHIPFIKKVQKNLIEHIKKNDINHIILIDYPGFNLNFAKKVKKLDVKIYYYISPQIWAWGQHRVKKIKQRVDKMFVLFPFEKEFYSEHNFDVEFVGHPLIEKMGSYNFLSKNELIEKYKLDPAKEILLILPGSRMNEVEKLFPKCVKAAEKLSIKHDLQTVVACSHNLDEKIFDEYRKNEFKVVKGNTYELFKYSKTGIIKSGTSTLEAGLFELPCVVVYSTSWLTYVLGKLLVKVKNIALLNIVAGKTVVKELIQDEVTETNIYNSIDELLSDKQKYEATKTSLSKLKNKLGTVKASERTAELILEQINES